MIAFSEIDWIDLREKSLDLYVLAFTIKLDSSDRKSDQVMALILSKSSSKLTA